MREAIEWLITYACDHPAAVGVLSLIWGVLGGWIGRICYEQMQDALEEREAQEAQEWLKGRGA